MKQMAKAKAFKLMPHCTKDTITYEMDELIRCKDCKFWSAERINDFNKCRRWINVGVKNFATMGEWFCADGERSVKQDDSD